MGIQMAHGCGVHGALGAFALHGPGVACLCAQVNLTQYALLHRAVCLHAPGWLLLCKGECASCQGHWRACTPQGSLLAHPRALVCLPAPGHRLVLFGRLLLWALHSQPASRVCTTMCECVCESGLGAFQGVSCRRVCLQHVCLSRPLGIDSSVQTLWVVEVLVHL